MLFLIYIRFLFVKIKRQHLDIQFKTSSYINDVVLIVKGKTAKENSKILKQITKTTFQWAQENAVTL